MRMRLKRCVSLLLVLCIAAALAACSGSGQKNGKNSELYGSPKEFDGPAHTARVMFVNVGKADCALVEVDGCAWLVDTGTEESFVNTYSAIAALGIESLAGVIVTHEHEDHAGGLHNILQKYPVEKVYRPEYLMSSAEMDSIISEAGAQGIKVKAGDTIPVCDGVEFSVLAPEKLLTDDDNDNSLVVRLAVNGRAFLFTGDMQTAEESVLLSSGADVSCDVLKVGNHGNKDATSKEFAEAASPLIAVISTDTSVDPNSASSIVKARLSMADVFTTQGTELGILLTVDETGAISVTYPERREASKDTVSIVAASKADQIFTVKNYGDEPADISGWFMYSTKGYEVFVYPEGTVLAPGAEFTVACRKSSLADSADYVWQQKKIWADNKEDIAVLCDRAGCEMARLGSG